MQRRGSETKRDVPPVVEQDPISPEAWLMGFYALLCRHMDEWEAAVWLAYLCGRLD